jgi:competence protein ComEC
MPQGLFGRHLSLVAFLPLILAKAPAPTKAQELWFSLLDVGQGLSAVIQTKNHILIYDTGPDSKVMVPFLKSQGIEHIDTILLSHTDLDHRGGLKSILEVYKPGKIITSTPEKLTESISDKCQGGQHWQWDGIDFEILSPHPTWQSLPHPQAFFKTNNQSCVLKVTTGQNSILLTGDIESMIEEALIQENVPLKARLLVVPHHGSKGSSTKAFIEKVSPEYALFAVGQYNRFGFPRSSVVEAYQAIGAKTEINALTGMIHFRLLPNTQTLAPLFWKKNQQHVWSQALQNGTIARPFRQS